MASVFTTVHIVMVKRDLVMVMIMVKVRDLVKERYLSLKRMMIFIQHSENIKLCKALSIINTFLLS